MIKKRFISMLVLLMTAVTGAWADTTVTWTASDMSGIYIDFLDGEAYNNTIKGITVTSSGGGGAGASWEGTDIYLNSGSTTITFTSSVGKIKSIAITAEDIEMSSIPSGWTTDYSTLSWSGEASTTVPLPLSGRTEISSISGIVFTIESTVNVTGVTLAPTSATLTLGETETVTLIPTVAPDGATDKSVTWSSSNEAVATVTDGVVTAVAAGEATITVTTTDGAFTATCAVTVAAPAASTYTVTLKEGTEDATSWTIAPDEATTTGVAAGTEVKASYGGTKKVKSVKAIKKTVPVTAITLNKTETSIKVGATETLSVTAVAPDNATDKTYTWKTSDETKATVDQDGKVTAVAAGTVTIYAEANDGSGVKGNCTVTVTPAAAEGHALSASAVGEIVGTDGKAYAVADKDKLPQGVTAVAMVAYVGTASDCAHGLAIALADESGKKKYGAARTACSGKAAVTGGTWRLPSIKDWQYMFIGCGASGSYSDNPSDMSYSGLASKLTTAQGDALSDYYWSSTEYEPGWAAWDVYFDGSDVLFYNDMESESLHVRACLAF